MKITQSSFRGMVPLVSPRGLPDNAAQVATNAKLLSGDLEAFRQFRSEKALANTGTVQTIYKLNDVWLAWNAQVDVARGLIPGDDTFRTFLTSPGLYDKPQFTNYDMATGGAEPYPFETRDLGVDLPLEAATLVLGVDTSDAANFSVDVLDEGDKLGEDWTSYGGSPHLGDSNVIQEAIGNPSPSYRVCFGRNAGVPAVMYRDFGVANAAAIQMEFEFMFRPAVGGNNYTQMCARFASSSAGQGVQISWARGGNFGIATASGWNTTGSSGLDSQNAGDTAYNVWYRVVMSMVRNADNTQTVTATLYDDADVELAQVSTTNTFDVGGYCGFIGETTNDDDDSGFFTNYDNIHVTASGTLGYAPVNTATSYVWTYKNDLGQESAPSPATATILRPDGVSVTVTTPTTLPAGYEDWGIETKVLYRAVSGEGGTVFKQVAEIPLAQADFLDTLNDEETGPNILESADWDVPPPLLQGIIALPNNCMAGFFKNQLCFSAAGFPHAWPVKYRKTTDTDIVAIANIDNTVVVGTKSFVYTATGNSPDAYSMSQPGEAQSCTSKLGMRYLDGLGVAFPSPDGYQLCRGSAGAVENITAKVFTREQWQDYDINSIIAAVHDGVLHWFTSEGESGIGFALDAKPGGFGLIRLAYHATALHSDPITDHLYLVLDENNEPTDDLLPVASTAVVPDGLTIYEFDGDNTSRMVYRYKGKLHLMPFPSAMQLARVRAGDFGNLVIRVYADGVEIDAYQVVNQRFTKIPALEDHDDYEIEFVGTSKVRTALLTDDAEEIE